METLRITTTSAQAAMDWLTFVVELLKATAWPAAAIVIAFLFRSQIRDLLARIKKGKIGPAEFEFEQGVRDLTEDLPPAVPIEQVPPADVTLASLNPRAAILEVWVKLEAVMNRLASSNSVDSRRGRSSLYQARLLHKGGVITNDDMAMFNDLRVLRNQAAHDEDFSPSIDSAIQYVWLAEALITRLNALLPY
ncbi:hypothetical protein [Stenotrophomonas sp.]|uniref:hypothetical protein n=1 Tax=Stenotrophomonas sp. TaxID=69392 RepID=UPI0029B80FD5|nr:hypothetical protein [Stenotrophomonas sp.]MDX3936380.1 hypothetical protein [Stenotrophomonas sp.]